MLRIAYNQVWWFRHWHIFRPQVKSIAALTPSSDWGNNIVAISNVYMYIWMLLHKLLMFCLFYLDRAVYLLSAYSTHWRLQERVFKVNILYSNRIESGTKPSLDRTPWTEPPQTKLFLNIGIPFAVFSLSGNTPEYNTWFINNVNQTL